MKKTGFFLLALSISLNTYSQNKEISLDPVAVSATLNPSAVSKSGRNIIVISAAEIEKMPASSLDEVLRYLPGMEVQSRGPMGAQADFSLRGATFQQVLVILDGVRINDPLTGHFSNYIPIAPSEIERIEILKGASSALYGADAVGGVINIISKSFQAGASGKSQQATAELGRGEYNLFKNRAAISWQNKGTVLNAGYLLNKTDGQLLRGSRSFLDMNTISLSAKQFIGENTSISYRFARDSRNFNAQNFYTQFLSDTATEEVISNWHQASFRHQHGKHSLQLDGAWKEVSDQFRFNRLSTANTNYSGIAQAQLTHRYRLSEKASLISGMQWISRSVESNNRGNHRIGYGGFFTVLNQQIGDKLIISPALRLDYNERSGTEILPQLNASYRTENFQFRGSAGRSTRDADFTERFNNYQPALVKSGGRMGNPGLKAESSWNAEAGTDFFGAGGLRISTSVFSRFHRNLIDYEKTAYADMPRQSNLDSIGSYLLAKNLSKVVTNGIETDIGMKSQVGENQTLDLSIGMVLMKSSTDGNTPSLYVSNHAKFLGNFNLIYSLHNFSLSANGVYKIRQVPVPAAGLVNLSPDYFMLNLRAECRLFENSLVLFFQADNVLDKKYADILGPQMPGRWLSGGIRVSFNR
jgi:iron complex outermembrane receptor protein